MVYFPADAEDATQEILIKLLTQLSTFQGRSSFRTWLYRIACNHVLNMKRGRGEQQPLSFSDYSRGLGGTPDMDLPEPASVPPTCTRSSRKRRSAARQACSCASIANSG